MLVPGAGRVAVLVNPANPNAKTVLKDVEAAARAMGLQAPSATTPARSRRSMRPSQLSCASGPALLFVGTDPFFRARRAQLASPGGAATESPRHMRCGIMPKPVG